MEAHYLRAGRTLVARRWRGRSGEIDLIFRDGAALVFVEVKSAQSHAIAAERLAARQIRRICTAASEFVAGEPGGQDSEMRFDVALLDRVGRVAVIENAIGP
ncbi:MAG: YraN family protein [Albidovulum sp.]